MLSIQNQSDNIRKTPGDDTPEQVSGKKETDLSCEDIFPPLPQTDMCHTREDNLFSPDDDTDNFPTKHRTKRKKKTRKVSLLWKIPLILCACILCGYLVFVYVPIPFIRNLRNIYIETAMTTGDHQWLATKFISSSIIDDVMAQAEKIEIQTGGEEYLHVKDAETETEAVTEAIAETEAVTEAITEEPESEKNPDDILDLESLVVGEKDYAGYEVLMIDKEEGLYVAEITGTGYKGRVMLIDDPARVFVGTTPQKQTRGYRIAEMMNYYGDVVAGINASGFNDPNDCGDGKDIIGFCMSEGEAWGTYTPDMASIVLTDDNRLVVGYVGTWESYNIRDGMQFGPPLIANGEVLVTGSAGRGIHPRTAIGQREDGVIIMLVVDGRDVSYSVGCTVGDMAEILAQYGAVNAGCCDGGSSCVLAYKGEVLNHNSSANPTYGRAMPNAFLVRSKKASE